MKNTIIKKLVQNQYVLNLEQKTELAESYYNAILLANAGIILDKPEFATEQILKDISCEYRTNIPSGFYNNPQDTRYFNCDELLVEQMISYAFYGNGRMEVFQKELPLYNQGREITTRTFHVITTTAELNDVLGTMVTNLCVSSRPWSIQDGLFMRCIHSEYPQFLSVPKCKDNILAFIDYITDTDSKFYMELLRSVDMKDVVKYAVNNLGETANLRVAIEKMPESIKTCFETRLTDLLVYSKKCPMSKKQTKYFNQLRKVLSVTGNKAEHNTPYIAATAAIKAGNPVQAAEAFKGTALYERNLRWMLSRAKDTDEVCAILNGVQADKPLVLAQITQKLAQDDGSARSFTFFNQQKVKCHIETEDENKKRQSILSDKLKAVMDFVVRTKIKDYYRALPSLGKIYIDPMFKKIALPINTSASGNGVGVLPSGSRVKLKGTKIRSFCYWTDVFDIDSSIQFMNDKGETETIAFWNFAKNMSDAIRFSGDCTARTGAEYWDLDIEKIKEMYPDKHYLVQTINGYGGKLNIGDIEVGYQVKEDFNTTAWDPKNIAFQFQCKGDSRQAINFAIDLQTNELVVLNLIIDNDSRTTRSNLANQIKPFLSLDMNMADIISLRGIVVDTPEEADVIFGDIDIAGKTMYHTYETNRLTAFINE